MTILCLSHSIYEGLNLSSGQYWVIRFFFKQIVLLHIKGLFILYGCMIIFCHFKKPSPFHFLLNMPNFHLDGLKSESSKCTVIYNSLKSKIIGFLVNYCIFKK